MQATVSATIKYKNGNEKYLRLLLTYLLDKHLRFTRQQGKREAISLTPLYHFHPPHKHLHIIRAIIADSSSLHIASNGI